MPIGTAMGIIVGQIGSNRLNDVRTSARRGLFPLLAVQSVGGGGRTRGHRLRLSRATGRFVGTAGRRADGAARQRCDGSCWVNWVPTAGSIRPTIRRGVKVVSTAVVAVVFCRGGRGGGGERLGLLDGRNVERSQVRLVEEAAVAAAVTAVGQVGRLVDAFGRFDGAAVTIVCVCVSAGDDVIGGVNFIRCKCLVEIGLERMIGLVKVGVE